MDKFGIFELLDALSQIATDREESEPPLQNAPAQRPSPDDKSFLPPDLQGENTDVKNLQRNALSSLYERHDSISKRIDKKK